MTHPYTARDGWLALSCYLAAAVVGCLLPATQLLGYEFAWLIVLVTALGGAWLLARTALLVRAGVAVLPLALALANSVRVKNCNLGAGVQWYLVLTLPHMLFLSTFAERLRGWFRGQGRAIAAYAVCLLVALALALYGSYRGPSVRVYSVFFGFFAGSIYDEALPLPSALLWHQTLVLLLFFALVLPRRLGLLCLTAALGIELGGQALGFRVVASNLHAALSKTVSTGHLVLHFKPNGQVDRSLAETWTEAERVATEVAQRLEVEPSVPTHVYLYDSVDEKEQFTGMRHTLFTRPWVPEVHVLADMSSLGHELVHAFGAEWHPSGFRLPARAMLLPNVGFVEGLAVAFADAEADSTRESMAALKQQGRFPDLSSLLSWTGFYAEAGGRAYTAVGDFVHWVAETRGLAALRKAYNQGDLAQALDVPLPVAIAQYEKMLDAVVVDPLTAKTLAEQLKERPLYDRVCGREQAERRGRAQAAMEAKRFDEAMSTYDTMLADDPRDLSARLGRLEALRRSQSTASDRERAYREALQSVLAADDLSVVARSRLLEQSAEEDVRRADSVAAEHDLAAALALATRDDDRRRLELKKLLLSRSDAADLLTAIAPETAPGRALLLLAEAFHRAPEDAAVAYLLARRVALNEELVRALRYLDTALADTGAASAALPHAVRFESLRLRVEWLLRLRAHEELVPALLALEAEASSPADKAKARAWRRRSDFYLLHRTW